MNIILLVHYTRKLADETISVKKISNGVMKNNNNNNNNNNNMTFANLKP